MSPRGFSLLLSPAAPPISRTYIETLSAYRTGRIHALNIINNKNNNNDTNSNYKNNDNDNNNNNYKNNDIIDNRKTLKSEDDFQTQVTT